LGAHGLAFRVDVIDSTTGSSIAAPPGVMLLIDYTAALEVYGGDFADRVRPEIAPACALSSVEDPECPSAQGIQFELDASRKQLRVPLSAAMQELAPVERPPKASGSAETVSPASVDAVTGAESTPEAPSPTGHPTDSSGDQAVDATESGSVSVSSTTSSTQADPTTTSTSLSPDSSAPVAESDPLPPGAEPESNSPGSTQPSGTVMMLSSGPTGSSGDFRATPQTNRSSWQVSPSTGSFDMTYPIRVPPAVAGPAPEVALNYSSGSLDNFTANRNAQPGWVGQGWSLEPGFIERSYRPCNVAAAPGDLCFAGNVFSMSLNGVSSRLVLSDPGQQLYRLESDPGWLVQKLSYTGGAFQPDPVAKEYFRVISPDGTQYYFGRNFHPGAESTNIHSKWAVPIYAPSQYMADGTPEPCWGQPNNLCYLAWRWNLDYVVDTNGNAMAHTWHEELNHYNARNLSWTNQWVYVRGGFLEHIDYTSNTSAAANARVDFVPASRCQGACSWPQDFPDTPGDLDCAPGAPAHCSQGSPTFYTKYRLDRISTQVRDTAGWRNVESTFFGQDYPQPADGSPAKLWLRAIQQQENASGTVLPPMQFTGVALSNRRTTASGVSPMSMYRINSIRSELGASTTISYGFLRDCDPNAPPLWWANTSHCFPQWVTDSSGASAWAIFKKHLVTSTTATDPYGSGPARTLSYDYGPTIGWHYSDDPVLPENGTSCTCARDNWNDFRGVRPPEFRSILFESLRSNERIGVSF
jgi:hypothetical protein